MMALGFFVFLYLRLVGGFFKDCVANSMIAAEVEAHH